VGLNDKILVAGGGGFIGGALISVLRSKATGICGRSMSNRSRNGISASMTWRICAWI